MGLGEKKYYNDKKDENSTPIKLCLYNSFPSKTKEPIGMVTPPLHTFASVPFEWEEAPGKPKATTGTTTNDQRSKSKTVRCLVPPPRLMSCNNASKITSMPSPTNVLDGPSDHGDLWSSSSILWSKSFSLSSRRSFRRGEGEERFRFTYRRRRGGGSSSENEGGGVEGKMDISSCSDRKLKKGIRRRSSSFLSLSSTGSNLWSSIYGSFKKAVPWKRMPEKPTTTNTS